MSIPIMSTMSKFLLPKCPFLPQYKNKNDKVFKGKNKYFGQIFTISSDRTADQRLCFRNIDSTAPIRNFKHQTIVYMAVHPSLCLTWSENLKTCYVVTWLIYQSEYLYHESFHVKTCVLHVQKSRADQLTHQGFFAD